MEQSDGQKDDEKDKSQAVPEEEELVPDQRVLDFKAKTEEQKDLMTCDEVFCLYLREISKRVNESYYKQCLRFVILYRECINECGWLKRRETFKEAGMLDEDTFLANLKTQEERQEELSKQQLGTLRPKDVQLAPVMNFDDLDLGELCPKFDIGAQEHLSEVANVPRKPSNISIKEAPKETSVKDPQKES